MQPVLKTAVLDIELDQIGRSLSFGLNIGELSSTGLKKWLHFSNLCYHSTDNDWVPTRD